MTEQARQTKEIFWSLIHPKSILFYLALLNFLHVPFKYGAGCFIYWSSIWYLALTVLIAASALRLGKWWSYPVAIFLASPLVYNFVIEFLKVFGFVAMSQEEASYLGTPENWQGFYIQNHPEVTGQFILTAVILCYSFICLVEKVFHKRRVLP